MFQSESGSSKTESQIRKSTENDIPRKTKRIKTADYFCKDRNEDRSVENIKTELNEESLSETCVKIERTELDEEPIINIKTELYQDGYSKSHFNPLIDDIETEKNEDLNIEPVIYPSMKSINERQSLHDIPDSLFEPLEKPVETKLEEFICEYCQKVLASSNGLGTHLRRIHSVERIFTCEQCGLEFPNEDRLKSHVSSQHGHKEKEKKKLLKCPQCILKFDRQSSLVNHINYTHKKKSQQHFCSGCGLGFSSASTLMVHSVYEQKLVKLPCEVCQVKTEVKLSCEMEKAFKDSGFKVKCKACTDGNKQPTSSKTEDELSTKVYSPDEDCVPNPIQKAKVRSKIIMLQGEDEGREEIIKSKVKMDQGEDGVVKYCCTDCEYTHKVPNIIRNHVESKHLPPGEYPCQECDKVFTTRNNLRDHLREHNPNSKQEKFSCKDCNYSTNKSTHLKRHVEAKHLPPGEYLCQECGKVCTTSDNLKSHISQKHNSRMREEK